MIHIHVGVLGLLHRKEATSLDLKLLETIGRLEGKGYRLQRQLDPASASIGGVKQGRTTKKPQCPLSYGTTTRHSNKTKFKAL